MIFNALADVRKHICISFQDVLMHYFFTMSYVESLKDKLNTFAQTLLCLQGQLLNVQLKFKQCIFRNISLLSL